MVQTAIDAVMIVAAPTIAMLAAEHVETAHRKEPGFFGLNRWHALWLWLIAYFTDLQ